MAKQIGSALDHVQLAANPAAPAAGILRAYARTDGRLYTEDSTGLAIPVSDLRTREPCRLTTQTNMTLSGNQSVDSVTTAPGDRVLLRGQTTNTENGIWVTAAGAWTRAADADSAAEVAPGTQVLILQGTFFKNHVFTQTGTVTTFATDAQLWRVVTYVDTQGSLLPPQPMGVGHMMHNITQRAMQVFDGGSWQLLDNQAIVTSATRPGLFGLGDGFSIYETDTGLAYKLVGGLWQPLSSGAYKFPCRVATNTGPITLSGLQTIDGVSVNAGDRVLVKNQGIGTPGNGIYIAATGAWSRAPDNNTALLMASACVTVNEGTWTGRIFQNKFRATDTLGTTGVDWWFHMNNLSGSFAYAPAADRDSGRHQVLP